MGDWKAIQRGLAKNPNAPWELYNLANDPAEARDVAAAHPERLAEVRQLADM
jgi:arylsulfatase A-like enzyme